jgi:hypothetical protein
MANLPETPQWEEGIYQIEVSDPVLGGPDGISNRQGKQLASRTLYLKQQVEKGGSDLAKHIPTPANSDNSKKLATTEFVAKALAALAGSAPKTLDTLKELADALGNDPNFATTVLNKLAEKLAKDQNGADIPDPALFVKNLQLGAGAPPIGIPFFWPSAAMPNTVMDEWSDMVFLKWNDATFSAATYPKLAKVIPSLKLTESRGEFIRTWDDGRGVDAGRALLSAQSFAMQNITGTLIDTKFNMNQGATGAFTLTTGGPADGAASGVGFASRVNFNAANVVNTAAETRSRNIAFNFLVRAK